MKKSTFKLTSLLIGIFFALLVLEIIARFIDISPGPIKSIALKNYRLSSNAKIGYEHIPGYKAEQEQYDDGHIGFSTNKDGLRDKEYQFQKPVGAKRIIVLGDSITVGYGIPRIEDVFTELLEKKLNEENPRLKYEILNFGVAGYQTIQEVEMLKTKGMKYSPDLVVLVVCQNDWDISTDGNFISKLLEKENSNFALKSLSWLRYTRLGFALYHRLIHHKDDYYNWYKKKFIETNSTLFETGIKNLESLSKKNKFEILVFILPSLDQLKHDKHKDYFVEKLGDNKSFNIYRPFEEFKRSNNLEDLFLDDLHFSKVGNKVIAQILYKHIFENYKNLLQLDIP